MTERALLERMRQDWNQRASEDAYYYTGFGRRKQDAAQFLTGGGDVVRLIESELVWLTDSSRQRALEIGCGPGRLMRALAPHFACIHGVDVSDKMVALAQENLRDIPNASVTRTNGTDLSDFPDDYFDFVYSFAVFQHIPSREVIFRYLEEVQRVLRTSGVFRGQFNGLAEMKSPLTTWSGACVPAAPVARFARERGLQLLATEGPDTRYMWVTWRKPATEEAASSTSVSIVRCDAPVAARYSPFSIELRGLSRAAGLNDVKASLRGIPCRICCIRPPNTGGIAELRLLAPPLAAGEALLALECNDKPLCPPAEIAIADGGPLRPRIASAADGVSALLGNRILSRVVKVVIEGVPDPKTFRAAVDDIPARHSPPFCLDPWRAIYELNVSLPRRVGPGEHQLHILIDEFRPDAVPLRVGLNDIARLFPNLPAGTVTLELDDVCRVHFAGDEGRTYRVIAAAAHLPFRAATFHAAAFSSPASPRELARVVRRDGLVHAIFAKPDHIARVAQALGMRHTGTRRLGRRVGAYFTGGMEPPVAEPWTNTCRGCRSAYSATWLESCGVVIRWRLFATYACPNCGTRNFYKS